MAKYGYGITTARDAKNLNDLLNMIANNIKIAANATGDDPAAYQQFEAWLAAHGVSLLSLSPQQVLVSQAAALLRTAIFVATGEWPNDLPKEA